MGACRQATQLARSKRRNRIRTWVSLINNLTGVGIAIVDNQIFAAGAWGLIEQCSIPSMPFFPLGFRFGIIGRDRSAEEGNLIESSKSVSPEIRVDTLAFIVRHEHDTLSIATVGIRVEKDHLRVDVGGSCLVCELLQVLIGLRRSVTATSAPMTPKYLEYKRSGHETQLELTTSAPKGLVCRGTGVS